MADNLFCDDCIQPLNPEDLPGLIQGNIDDNTDEISKCCEILTKELEGNTSENQKLLDKVCKKGEKCLKDQTNQCCSELSSIVNNMTSVVTSILTESNIQNNMVLNNLINTISNNSSVISSVVGDTTTNITNTTGSAQPVNVDVDVNSPITVNLSDSPSDPTDLSSVLNFIVAELSSLRAEVARLRECCDKPPPPNYLFPTDLPTDGLISGPVDLGPPQLFIPPVDLGPPKPVDDKPVDDKPTKYVPPNVDVNVFNNQLVSVNVTPTPVTIVFTPVTNVVVNNIPPKVPLPDKVEDEKPKDKPVDETPKVEDTPTTDDEKKKGPPVYDVANVEREFLAWRFGDATKKWRENAAAYLRLPHLATIEDIKELVQYRKDKLQVQVGQQKQG